MADRLSPSDLATLSLLDPEQGVCPNGHGCRFDQEIGFRRCSTCAYRGLALVCWDIQEGDIETASAAGADPGVLQWARDFVADR